MTANKYPSKDDLHEWLRYDMDQGALIWKKTKNGRALVGTKAGKFDSSSKRALLKFNKREYPLRDVIWFFHYGRWPTNGLSYLDGNYLNNHISNLLARKPTKTSAQAVKKSAGSVSPEPTSATSTKSPELSSQTGSAASVAPDATLPSIDELRDWLYHDDYTGFLRWKETRGNKSSKGDFAGYIDADNGKYKLSMNGKHMLAGRVIWAMEHGSWPTHRVIHKDGDDTNFHIENLALLNEEPITKKPSVATDTGEKMPISELCQWFEYDEDKGVLLWKKQGANDLLGTKKPGMPVSGQDGQDLKAPIALFVAGKAMQAHHVVWALQHGEWPKTRIFFKDGNKHNIRHDNLTDGQHGANGVFFNPEIKKWGAYTHVKGKKVHLGSFGSMGIAIATKKRAEDNPDSITEILQENKARRYNNQETAEA